MDILNLEEKDKPSSRKYLMATVLACNLGSFTTGILFGWTSPVLPKLSDPNRINENPFEQTITYTQESWIGSTMVLGAIFGPFLGGFTADKIGRKSTLLICAGLPFLVSFLILAFAKIPVLYCVARFIGGFGLGNLFTALPMYFGEISEPSNRGAVSSTMNVFNMLGILYAYSVGPYVSIMVFSLLCAVIPVTFILMFLFFPESPYYLLAKNKIADAEKALMKLRSNTMSGIENELKAIQTNIKEEMANKGSLLDIIKSKRLTRALLISLALVFFQQVSGIVAVLFSVTSIFQASGSSFSSDLSAIIVATVQVIASLSTPILADRLGRRILLLASAIGMLISEIPLGLYFYLKDNGTDVSAVGWLPIVSLVAFVITYNLGFGPLPWTVMGEVFPSNVKSAASTVTASVCWVSSFLIANMFSTISNSIGIGYTFWIFSGFCFLAAIFTYLCVIETKGKSFQEIQEALDY